MTLDFYVIIDHVISAPRHGREVVDGLNAIGKMLLFQLISTVKLTGAKSYGIQMVMHTGIRTSDVILATECQKHLSTGAHKHGVIDKRKYKKQASK